MNLFCLFSMEKKAVKLLFEIAKAIIFALAGYFGASCTGFKF